MEEHKRASEPQSPNLFAIVIKLSLHNYVDHSVMSIGIVALSCQDLDFR